MSQCAFRRTDCNKLQNFFSLERKSTFSRPEQIKHALRRPSDALPADNRPLEHVWPRPGWRIHVLWPSLEWVVGFDLPCVKSSRGWSSYELFRGRVMVLDSMKVLVGEFALRESCVLVALCVT